jgi:ribosome maturation factor RimP
MYQKISDLINPEMNKIGLWVNEVRIEKEGQMKSLVIVLDSEKTIDLDKIVEASKIINPMVDKANLIDEEYILDIYAKEKGGDYHE